MIKMWHILLLTGALGAVINKGASSDTPEVNVYLSHTDSETPVHANLEKPSLGAGPTSERQDSHRLQKRTILHQLRTVTLSYHCPISGYQQREIEFAAYFYMGPQIVHIIPTLHIENDFFGFYKRYEGKSDTTVFGARFEDFFCPRSVQRLCTYHLTGAVKGRYSIFKEFLRINLIHDDPNKYYNPVITETCNPASWYTHTCPAAPSPYTQSCTIKHLTIEVHKGMNIYEPPPGRRPWEHKPPHALPD